MPSAECSTGGVASWGASWSLTPLTQEGMIHTMNTAVQTRGMAEWRIRNLPERVRKALKLWSVEDDKPMNQLIIEILTQAVDTRRKVSGR